MNPRLQEILHNITTRLAALEEAQKKEWQGLPNDEVIERANEFRDPETYLRGVLWAEAKLKEKNG
jgi:hypothetical protein